MEVQNNTVVADNGALLRGAHGNATNHVYKDLSWWEDLRDTYKLNVVRLDTRITKPHDSNDVEDLVNMNNLFANVDDAVDTAELAGMYIIIDNHTSCCLKYNPELVRRFWEMAAPRYKDRTHVMYELQNEPVTGNKGFEDVDIQFQEEMYHFIRQRAPDTHIILWSFAKITNTSKSAVDRAPGIDYSNASVGAHPYGHLTRDIGFEHLSELRSSYPVLISEFTILKETDPAQVWNYAEDQELSWVYLDRRDGGNHGDGVADPEEWPLNWPGDPACP
ncbi:MAG TPA: cellulase family glycosylhydrolase [Gemmatimonadota bacterium]|nr:cellulase family glycosylhydrolase [Gemmatimonadota bacterium]